MSKTAVVLVLISIAIFALGIIIFSQFTMRKIERKAIEEQGIDPMCIKPYGSPAMYYALAIVFSEDRSKRLPINAGLVRQHTTKTDKALAYFFLISPIPLGILATLFYFSEETFNNIF